MNIIPSNLVAPLFSAGVLLCAAAPRIEAQSIVVAWGQNAAGQCNVPALPSGLSYVDIEASWAHTAARRSDGSLVLWESNGWGQFLARRSRDEKRPAISMPVRYATPGSQLRMTWLRSHAALDCGVVDQAACVRGT